MAKQNINVGASANDRSGDSLRLAFQKINANFTELYTALGLDTAPLNLGAFEFSGSTLSTTDSSSITIDQATTVTSNLTVGGDILPSVANGGDLGSAAKPWRSLYVSESTIYIGNHTLGINDQGELTFNNNRVAHENGEFMTLDNLSDLNVNSPNAGDTIAWMGSHWVNVPLYEDKLHSEGDEVVLVGGANPYVTFPAITGGDQLIIQGAEVSSVSGSLALTSQDNLNIIANGSGAAPGGSKNWTFSADGSLTIPGDIRSEQAINIDINLSDSTLRRWTFGEDGVLNAPASSSLYNANLFDIRSQSDYTAWVRTSGQTGLASINSTGVANVAKVEAISQQPAHVDITVESGQGPKVWSFDFTGSITFPVGNFNVKENAYDFSINTLGYDDETTLSWTFDRSGHFNVPLSIEFFNSAVGVNAIGTMYGQSEGMVIAGYTGRNLQIAANDGTGIWTFGTDGSLTLPGNLQSNGNINVEINLADSTKRIWQFGEDGVLNVPGAIQLANGAQIFNTVGIDNSITIGATATTGNTTFNGSGFFNGDTYFNRAIQEKFSSLQDATGVVAHNCENGHIFYHTSPDANWTVNLTNFSLITNYATAITIIISQGGTGYYPNALQIGGAAQTINWQGNTTPTPSTNRVDVVTFSIFLTGSGYTVLGQLTGF